MAFVLGVTNSKHALLVTENSSPDFVEEVFGMKALSVQPPKIYPFVVLTSRTIFSMLSMYLWMDSWEWGSYL